jgi:hypothetical protein
MDRYNTTGLTLVFEDDYSTESIARFQESISVVPDDWDIIRFNCIGDIPSDFPILQVERKIELGIERVFETRHDKEQPPCNATKGRCWFCGGAYAMLWRGGESVQKLRKLWSRIPHGDIDCDLTQSTESSNIKSYCINFREGEGGSLREIEGEESDIPKNDQYVSVTSSELLWKIIQRVRDQVYTIG